jgi:hypothetical protein
MGGMKQFSIRDWLFLVVTIAVALGWWADHHSLEANRKKQEHDLLVKLHDTAAQLDSSLEARHQLVSLLTGRNKGNP